MKSIVKIRTENGIIKYRIFVKGAPLEVFDLIKKETKNDCPQNYKEYVKQ